MSQTEYSEIRCPKEMLGRTWTYLALDRRVLCVALKGEVNDWSAYIGAVEGENHTREVEDIAHKGTKLPYWMAKKLFPTMDRAYAWRDWGTTDDPPFDKATADRLRNEGREVWACFWCLRLGDRNGQNGRRFWPSEMCEVKGSKVVCPDHRERVQ